MKDTNDNKGWEVSTAGGPTVTGRQAAKMLGVSYTSIYSIFERDLGLKRAVAYNPARARQPLVYYLADIQALQNDRYALLNKTEKAPAEETPQEGKKIGDVVAA